MEPAAAQSPSTSPHWPPLALWLTLQLLILLIPVSQTPLADQFPRPPERQALYIMAAAQLALSAFLFPVLFRPALNIPAVVASTWPLLLLSGLLASAPATRIALTAAYISTWLLTLALWNFFLKSPRARLTAVALACALVLGGPLLLYLRAEFNSPAESQVPVDPISCAFALIDAPAPALAPWRSVLALAIAALITAASFAVRRYLRSRRGTAPISAPSYPQPAERLSH
jgi:hypothetical protein